MVVAVTVFLLEGTHESAIRGTFDGFDVDALPLRGLLTRALSPADAEPGDGISCGRTADSNTVAMCTVEQWDVKTTMTTMTKTMRQKLTKEKLQIT